MIFRTLSGLTFKVHSPSLFELCAHDDQSPIALVSLALVGRLWYIDVLMKQGHSIHRGPFKSREAAAAMIAGRMERVS